MYNTTLLYLMQFCDNIEMSHIPSRSCTLKQTEVVLVPWWP